jgi:hypothetical protein
MTKVTHVFGNQPTAPIIRVHFSPEEIAAAKEHMRQHGIGSFSDFLRWLLRGGQARTQSAQERRFVSTTMKGGKKEGPILDKHQRNASMAHL